MLISVNGIIKLCHQIGKLFFLLSLTVLGYFYHLFTDKMFFDDLFNKTFECLNDKGIPTIYAKEVRTMRVHKNGKLYSVEDFWNGENKESIYYDYTRMNKILLEYYGSTFNRDRLLESSKLFINPGIEEVDYNNIASVINKTYSFIQASYKEEINNLIC